MAVLIITLSAQAQIRRIDTVHFDEIHIPRQRTSLSASDYMYTISIKSFALEHFPQLLNQPIPGELHRSYLNGLMFKFNDKQISYRISGSFFNKGDISSNNVHNDMSTSASGRLQNIAIKLGFEKNMTYTRLQPYFGMDIGYMRQEYEGKTHPRLNTYVNVASENFLDRKNSILLSGFIGLKFHIASYFTLAAEANVNGAYSFQKTDYSNDNGGELQFRQDNRNKWEYFFSPLGMLSLQFNFGSIY